MTTTCGCGETITSEAHAQRHGKDCGLQGYPRGWAEKQGRPKLLDLFCGAGGASMGYHRAGFDVVGVDIEAQPDYPFPFYQGDALAVLHKLLDGHILGFRWPGTDGFTTWHTLGDFAAIHTSPPCQASTALTKGTNKGRDYVQLIPETRELLATTDRPTVIENVQGAEVRRDATLCGEMFGLDVIRHRYFEVDGILIDPPRTDHTADASAVGGMEPTTTAPMSLSTATAAARALCGSGRWQWASTGPTAVSRSPRPSRPPTPSSSAAS